jgi:phosphate transport system permease protein
MSAIARANPLTAGRLPRWANVAVLAAAAIVFGVGLGLTAAAERAAFPVPLFVITTVLGYLVLLVVLSRVVEGPRRAKDRLMRNLVVAAFLLALTPLISLIVTVVGRGAARFDVAFFTESMRNVTGEGGGVLHAVVGTLEITAAATLISVPIGLLTAIYLVEYGRGWLARAITFFVDVMTGIPSIVAGLFAYSLFVLFFGPGTKSGMAGAVSLCVLMIPVVVRSIEELLRIVPNELREAAYALGVPKWLTIVKVVLPTAAAGIVTGVMLAVARVIGETAPLLIAAGFTQGLNNNPMSGPMMTLPVYVYRSYIDQGNPASAYLERAWAGALTLILIVMILNLAGRLIAAKFAPKAGR